MRRECMQAVALALGRELNQVEARDIETRVTQAARRLAQADPAAWITKPKHVKLAEAGQQAAIELLGEAQLKAEREALQLAANARIESHLADMEARGVDRLDALDRKIAFKSDGKANGLSIESQYKAIRADFLRQLIPVMEATNPQWFGLLANMEGVTAIVKEIHGEDSGNPVAKAGAKIWKEVAEKARERFNAAGGDIGELDDWGMPHHHSQVRVARAGRDAWLKTLSPKERAWAVFRDTPPPRDFARDHWVAEVLPRLKREKYVNADGTRMDDVQLTEFLQEAWVTIATGGANKMQPGQFSGGGARANRGNASRQIHFKDAQNYLDYQKAFGEKSLEDVLTGHIDGISKDIALVEEFGPNPDHTFRYFRDQAVAALSEATPGNLGRVRKRAVGVENLYNEVAGKTLPVASKRLADSFDTVRDWLTASHLGGAAISSLTDDATLHLTARVNNLPAMRVIANELAALNPTNKVEERMANRAGLALNTFISSLNRFGQDGLGATFSRKMATSVMRVQGLAALTEARRRAFGVTAMHGIGAIVKDHAKLADIHTQDHRILSAKGVTDENFRVWKEADLEDWGSGNDTMLTPDAIYRTSDEAIDKAIGPRIQKLKDEAKAAVDELAARDVQDAGWVNKRAQKLAGWLAKERAKVDKRIAKADAATQAELQDASARMKRLEETVEYARASWDTPQTRAYHGPKEMLAEFGEDMPLDRPADYPGIDPQKKVGFYGKGKLRKLGMDEGRAREATRNVEAGIRDLKKSFEKTKAEEIKALTAGFLERQADFAEFVTESQTRIARRGKVADRLNRDLTPAIERARIDAREKAVTRLLGLVLEETDMAVIEPGARERAIMGAGIQRGTWKGELARSFWLFKSFPMAMITKHLSRAWSMPNRGGRWPYIAALMAGTTILGAVAMQIKEVMAGRDPRNLNPFGEHGVQNWMKAILQGGSLGLYGDFLFSQSSQYGRSAIASFLGPVAGAAEEAFSLTQGNIMESLSGDDTHAGAEAVRFVKSNLPGANLWYTKAPMDHMVWNALAEYFSPGYLAKVRARAQTQFGQEYFWDPADPLPERAPDLGAIAGESE